MKSVIFNCISGSEYSPKLYPVGICKDNIVSYAIGPVYLQGPERTELKTITISLSNSLTYNVYNYFPDYPSITNPALVDMEFIYCFVNSIEHVPKYVESKPKRIKKEVK